MSELSTISLTIKENEVAHALYYDLFIALMIGDSLCADRAYVRLAYKKPQNIMKESQARKEVFAIFYYILITARALLLFFFVGILL